ncbi:MAG TPA: hypothetical protein VER98_13915 [Terriglobia bacterium]|nr:hypothetical protein [Terriglobia bacterium]
MPTWISALVIAILVAVIPFTFILRLMLQLPKPIALSHRRWPLAVNFGVMAAITAYTTIFIRSEYYGRATNPISILMEFVIAALAYIFGLVLLLRQFSGLYPEYIITAGRTGLSIRKTAYRNIIDIAEVSRSHGEAQLRIRTSRGLIHSLTLPVRSVPALYERVKPQL